MAIVKMKKFHLLALDSQKETLLNELQIFRDVQFVESFIQDEYLEKRISRDDVSEKYAEYEDIISKCNYAIELISKYSHKISPLKAFIKGIPNYTFHEMEKKAKSFDIDREYKKIKLIGDQLSVTESRIMKKKEQKNRLMPIADFDIALGELEKIKRLKAVTGSVSQKLYEEFSETVEKEKFLYYEKIGTGPDEVYYLLIYDPEDEDDISELMRVSNFNKVEFNIKNLPKDEIAMIDAEISDLENKKEEIIKSIQSYEMKLEDFEVKYEYTGNIMVQEEAKENFIKTEKVCLIEGYFPAEKEKILESIVKDVTGGSYYMELEEVDRYDDDIPIMLKNNKIVKVFESVTSTYALPRYREIDPTPYYAPFYALFFGMMAADVGYGLSLFILTTLALKFANMKPSFRQNVKFFQLISISATIWGFLYGSYFGASIPGMWRLLDLSKQFMTVLVISMAIGGINLYYALFMKAYMCVREKDYSGVFFDVIAWYITLTSAICLLLSLAGVLGPSVADISKYFLIIGIVSLFIGGAKSAKGGVGSKIALGFYNIYGLSGYIGDFVSYSRLMALGMAGGCIASAVNMIAGMVIGKGIIGAVFGVCILVFFHAFNLFLSCLGAYVHALRLVYVEFFQKFYEGGGKPFRFFRKESEYINLDRHLDE